MAREESSPSEYQRRVTSELGTYAGDSYALYTELHLSATPWKDIAEKMVALQTGGPPFISNLAAWGSLRRRLLVEFEEFGSGQEYNTKHS